MSSIHAVSGNGKLRHVAGIQACSSWLGLLQYQPLQGPNT